MAEQEDENTKYVLTGKGHLCLRLTEEIERMLIEQRRALAAILRRAAGNLTRSGRNFGAAAELTDALVLLGMMTLIEPEA